MKFFDDANEIKLIAQSKYFKIIYKKDSSEYFEDYV